MFSGVNIKFLFLKGTLEFVPTFNYAVFTEQIFIKPRGTNL